MLYKFYRSVFSLLDYDNKSKFTLVIIVSILASIFETVTISSIFPFMSIVTNPDKIHTNKYFAYLYQLFDFKSQIKFIVIFGIIIALIFIIKTLFNILAHFISLEFGHQVTKNIKTQLVAGFLAHKYIYFLRANKSNLPELLGNINTLANAIASYSIIITESFIIAIMYVALMLFNWKIMTGITLFLAFNIFLVQRFIHSKISQISKYSWINSLSAHRYIVALINNYKIVKLVFDKQKYVNHYKLTTENYLNFEAKRMLIERLPKNILEMSGFLIMISLIIYQELAHGLDSSSTFIPMISLLMLTFYRLLPSVTRIIDAKSNIAFVTPVIELVQCELNKKNEFIDSHSNISLTKNLQLLDIKFSYTEKKQILCGVSLTIKKGEHIAFIGESGSGKSTLVDIIMGFYDSDEDLYKFSGAILVDGESLKDSDLIQWRRNIGYIPQEIYLFDGTVADNIVMGGEHNEEKVIQALKKASIWEFLQQKEGMQTLVGDGGVMLSGGQKQRIGIARALYNDPEIIVMDEATSALDDYTERQIIEELNNSARGKTIIMIAHRLSSLKNCDRIYELNKGVITKTYNSMSEI